MPYTRFGLVPVLFDMVINEINDFTDQIKHGGNQDDFLNGFVLIAAFLLPFFRLPLLAHAVNSFRLFY